MDAQLKACAEAQRRIPLELQASLPLPGRKGQGTAECWYTIWHAVRMALRSIPRSGMPCGIYPACKFLR